MSDIEESLKRITSHNGVMGVAVLDDAGKLARCVHCTASEEGLQRAIRKFSPECGGHGWGVLAEWVMTRVGEQECVERSAAVFWVGGAVELSSLTDGWAWFAQHRTGVRRCRAP